VFKRHGVEISIAQARAPMGLEKRDHIRAISQQPEVLAAWQAAYQRAPTDADIDRMYQVSVEIQKTVVTEYADLIPGTLEAVADCRQRGLKIGSSTGYSQTIMDSLVPAAKAQGYTPDAILCPSNVPAGRPAPYMMYQNALQLNVYPMAAVVKVGDTLPDIEEGLNAGSWIVAVTQSGNELGLSAAEASALADDELTARLTPIETRFRQAGAHNVIRTVAELPPVLDDIEARLRDGEHP
jgi:phosphonoacetaldehyde hydrolase